MIINEAETMKKLLSRVEQFTEFAKNAKNKSEKEQLEQDSVDLQQEIKQTTINPKFKNSLLSALVSAGLFLTPQVNAETPIFSKICDRVQTGLSSASNLLDDIVYVIVNSDTPSPKHGVIGKGKLFDGNNFLEYADGGKLVYRADLGNENKSTYFKPTDKYYKNTEWDEAIIEIHPIDGDYDEE